jgi:hypothetical protein
MSTFKVGSKVTIAYDNLDAIGMECVKDVTPDKVYTLVDVTPSNCHPGGMRIGFIDDTGDEVGLPCAYVTLVN